MTSIVQQAAAHWRFVAPLLNAPQSEDDYDALVAALDELLGLVGDDEEHPLASLASHMGDLIEEYDDANRPMPEVRGADMLRHLMQWHGLDQSSLPEVGTQSVISEILNGKRRLNVRQIKALTLRFGLPADLFLD
ncbi:MULTISPECIES: helix-turn-helix domain-containing protein [Halomonas]|uniref:HTH-type transcriptional regulator / antitoxin HigA n=1 Tax=Halomonas shengliensis TaxID=419597 RepID=A0A1H0CQC1_9GAMM|nr:transcriptional regulator [Halomonas shengliensis]SDN60089.1 HTH-type transcriptional regulator / antitoxin HigA [Halomonas shengliensis]